MARSIRVLIVDDSALVRHRLRTIIGGAPGFEVVGALSNVRDCLAQLRALQPDVITLDIWMPEMDGLTALRHIMAERPTPVVMVSSLTQAGAHVTLEALALGATDFVTKPSAISTDGADPFSAELLGKLSIAAAARPGAASTGRGAAPAYLATPPHTTPAAERHAAYGRPAASDQPLQPLFIPARAPAGRPARPHGDALIVIGSSTGGPQVLDRLFTDLGDDVPAAILVVQHIPELFTPSLAARLGRRSGMEVHEAQDGDALVPGVGLVARGGWHVTLGSDQLLHLDQSAPVHGVRPAVDRVLFSIAEHWHGPCLTVILTGMGNDGTPGARAMRERGGEVLAQDESTSIVYGMPRSVVEAGLASAVLPIDQMAAAIRQWARPAAPVGARAVQVVR